MESTRAIVAASVPEPVDSAGAVGIAAGDATAVVVSEVLGTAEVAGPAGAGAVTGAEYVADILAVC